MKHLTEAEKKQIADAIREVESRSRGELVTVITQASDEYLYIPALWAAMIALLIPGLLGMINHYPLQDFVYSIQVSAFFACALLFRWQRLKMRLIPKEVRNRRARRYAHELFLMYGLQQTQDHTGIMLFVSIDEQYVEIIADKGVNDLVNQSDWAEIVKDFVDRVKEGKIAEGYLNAIKACGKILHTHFPVVDKNSDELPNHLIEI